MNDPGFAGATDGFRTLSGACWVGFPLFRLMFVCPTRPAKWIAATAYKWLLRVGVLE